MTKTAGWLLSAGVLLFVGMLLSQDLPAILAMLAHAGWGLLLVALFHLLPLLLDAWAIRVLFEPKSGRSAYRGYTAGVIADADLHLQASEPIRHRGRRLCGGPRAVECRQRRVDRHGPRRAVRQ